MARDARPPRRAGAVGVGAAFDFHAGLVPQAPALDAARWASSGPTASRRSRAACGGATCATTRASWSASRASTAGAPAASLASALHELRRRGHRPAAASACRSRCASPTAACACSASTTTPSASPRCATRRMPFEEPGTDELLARASTIAWLARAPPTPRRPTRSCSRSARRRSRTSRSTCATSARCSTTCCRVLRAGHLLVLRSTVAPRHDRVRRRLPGEAARLRGRRGHLRRARARAHRRRPLPRGDRDAAVHRRRRRRGARASAPRALFEPLGAPIVQTTPVAGRAGEDLDQHPALRDVRAAQPADDGLRAATARTSSRSSS